MDSYLYNDLLQRIEDLERRLQCVGDDIGISVEQTPGGQIIRNIQDLPAQEDNTVSYIKVSYDSVTTKFTVTVTSLPVMYIDWSASGAPPLDNNSTVSSTLVFDKPATDKILTLYAAIRRTNFNTPEILWNGTLTASDSDTELTYTDSHYGTKIAGISLLTTGGYSVDYQPPENDRVVIQRSNIPTVMYVDTTNRRIYVQYLYNPFTNTSSSIDMTYTEPFNDFIILTFNNGSTTLDIDALANIGSYSAAITIGKVKISSGNKVQECHLLNQGIQAMLAMGLGYTNASINVGTKTLNVRNGRIINIT